ncbi:MAG: hypothetical protein RM021_017440 [Nostoc sp. EkiNYC01]|nr:hypothetical protein [Nostoc sp. EkiNYC01]
MQPLPRIEFIDFWSVNRWLCQYLVVVEEDCCWVDRAIIVHPLAKTPYHSTEKFKYWHPDRLRNWLQMLDTWTADVCSFDQYWDSGKLCPSFEFKLFPCADGRYYAAYPTTEPKYYVAAFDFSPSLCSAKRSPEEREKETQQLWLNRGQQQISFAARRLWSCVLRNEDS